MSEKSLIDEALEKEGLHSSSAPQELSGVKTFDTKENIPLEIIKTYHEKDWVKCSCGINKLHKQGIVVQFDNGNHGLMGLNCARRDFGDETVNNLESRFAAKKRTSINKSYIAPTRKKIQEYRVIMATIKNHAAYKDSFFSELRSLAGDVYKKLTNSAEKKYGRWTKEVITTRTVIDKSGKEKTVREAQEVTIFVIDGYKAISLSAESSTNSVLRLLDRAEHYIDIEPYEDKNIEASRKYLRDAEQTLNEIQEQMDAAKSFFAPQNFKAICRAVEKDNILRTELFLTKRKLRVPSEDWNKNYEYIDIPYFLVGLSDDGTKKMA